MFLWGMIFGIAGAAVTLLSALTLWWIGLPVAVLGAAMVLVGATKGAVGLGARGAKAAVGAATTKACPDCRTKIPSAARLCVTLAPGAGAHPASPPPRPSAPGPMGGVLRAIRHVGGRGRGWYQSAQQRGAEAGG